MTEESDPGAPVLAVVRDLFFVARIRETARLTQTPLTFTRSPEDLAAALPSGARWVLLDLTGGFDYAQISASLDGAATRPPVPGYTTHALARETQPWHGRCDRVVTKETLTQELPALMQRGIAA